MVISSWESPSLFNSDLWSLYKIKNPLSWMRKLCQGF